jgi:toxin ParE1/3/4
MRIVWSEPASRDLEDIGDYIAFPHSGRRGHRENVRELVVPRTSYIVPYRVHQDRIEILAVFHGARDWQASFYSDS